MAHGPLAAGRIAAAKPLLEGFCVPFLIQAQNPDGGWGGRPGARSAVESTAWALLALKTAQSKNAEAVVRGQQWLAGQQLADGSFPAYPGMQQGCWASAIAAWALHLCGNNAAAVQRASIWLAKSTPRTQRWGYRMRRWLWRTPEPVTQDHSLRGWSWTPKTSSWVEPTAYTLLFFRKTDFGKRHTLTARRIRMAESMLLNRVCPGGGWNNGNPMVYGVAGEAQVSITAWALLALRPRGAEAAVQQSLSWLQTAAKTTRGPSSAAIAHICLRSYGPVTADVEAHLWGLYQANQFLQSVQVVSLSALALLPDDWLPH